MTSMSNENNDWLQCVKWLMNCQCLTQILIERFISNDLTLNEFANALRDGEILCNLANFLLPGSIDVTQINKRAHMSQMLCLKNIRLFLNACKSHFNLNESDLFDEHMLYELDLSRVIRALSALSQTSFSLEHGIEGFKLTSNLSTRISLSNQLDSSDDIYFNLQPTETESPDSYYTDASFLLGNSSLNDTQSDGGVYQMIVQQPHHHHPLKRDFVIREILNTEENFINGLNTLMNDFLVPLSKILNDSDKKILCINIESLISLHQTLYDDLYVAVQGGPGMTSRICSVFEAFKLSIMKEYSVYFSHIDRALSKCDSLVQANDFKLILEECKRTSKRGNFKLTDLLRLPYQRVLKYHLLFNELLKQTDVEHSAKDMILQTKESMREVGNYLNECERDKENLTRVEKIIAHLTCDSKLMQNFNLKKYAHYVKDDKFRCKSSETGERIARTRTFFLFELALIICKSKGDLYHLKEILLIEDYLLEDPNLNFNGSNNNNTSSYAASESSLSTGVVNIINHNANAYSLVLTHLTKTTKSYTFYFKNQEQKKIWKNCLLQVKQKIQPEGHKANKHVFKLTNFDHHMIECHSCNKYLLGIYYQGYKCEQCSYICHRNCLLNTPQCRSHSPTNVPSLKQRHSFQSAPVLLERSPSFKQQSFLVRAVYKYDGRPCPPEYPVLTFNEGDLVQVTDEDDDEWWKGYLVKSAGKDEGYFPSRYVKLYFDNIKDTPSSRTSTSFDDYPWFAAVDRQTADLILSRIPNKPSQTIFMVRCRQEGGFAISIKFNRLVEHIKINVNYLEAINAQLQNMNLNSDLANTTAFYSIDQRNFSSLVNLVKYYSQNSLKDNFPQLETTLGLAFRDALPIPISIAVAIYDYNPLLNPNNTGEQIELKRFSKYYVLNKELNGWWRVYNLDGLIGYVPGGYLEETVKI